MRQSEKILLAIALCLLTYVALSNDRENKRILKELKDLNSTLEYIDKRMDTLEFYRMPD